MATKLGSNRQQADQQEFDPECQWQENAAGFLLKVHLPGFRKEDFRVQVDGAGRLTVRGQRAAGTNKHVRFHKVFQLPPTSNLEGISGRFDAGVLNITVPRRPAPSPPTATDDIINKPKRQKTEDGKDSKAKKAEPPQPQQQKEEINKPKEDAKKKMEQEQKTEAKRSEAEQEHKKEPPAVSQEEAKPKVSETTPPQPVVAQEESLLERVRRRAEEEKRAKAAAEEAERQRKKQNTYSGWKERVSEELQGLTSSQWAEGVVETVKKNKEVIAVAIAAFSLGLFVSSRLCSGN